MGNISGLDPAAAVCLEIRKARQRRKTPPRLQPKTRWSAPNGGFTSTNNSGSSWDDTDSTKHAVLRVRNRDHPTMMSTSNNSVLPHAPRRTWSMAAIVVWSWG